MSTITLFSWGYWSWGNATRQLVEAVDAAEQARGFEPPLFVDVRISRSVRAVGFRDHAFEQLLGKERYVWLRSLGNRHIETRTGPTIQIAKPEAAYELLDLALKAAEQRRRLLFFCSCERPINDHGEECHRVTVAKLVREAAKARGIAIRTVEWPGGEPTTIQLDVTPSILRAARRGRASLLLAEPVALAEVAGLAWGSIVQLRADGEELKVGTGPVKFQTGGWYLPLLKVFAGSDTSGSASKPWAETFRRDHGHEPEEVVVRQLSPSCIYTIAHLDKLRALEARGGSGTLKEAKPWTSGRKLLERAREAKLDLPILFADATDCSQLLYWAVITSIKLTTDGTTYSFERLRSLPGNRTPQKLVLLSTGKKIAPGYIRPYALCRTPPFLLEPAVSRS